MKILLDTNVVIPIEPTSLRDVEALSGVAAELMSVALSGHHEIFLHPLSRADIARDKDAQRAELRRLLLSKYPMLPDPPEPGGDAAAILGTVSTGGNDWVDHHMLAALRADAIDILVTEDLGIRRKARRLGIDGRVLTIKEAVEALASLGERPVAAPPAVVSAKCHALRAEDPIWQSFQKDYLGFDKWLSRCRREHRQSWHIPGHGGDLAAVCIVKSEGEGSYGMTGKVLKLCSFKVSHDYNGLRYGELLLRCVFDFVHENRYDWSYVTVLPKYTQLVELFEAFGFEVHGLRTSLGEFVLRKQHSPPAGHSLRGLSYTIAYGPPRFDGSVNWFLVPIQPRYTVALFPEAAQDLSLFPGRLAFGNAIRKAYLCRAPIRLIKQSDVLAFYRSKDSKGVVALGVVELALVSKSPEEITRVVVRRTVYSEREISGFCEEGPVLVLLFRLAKLVRPCIPAKELSTRRVFTRPPQSIMRIEGEGLEWLRQSQGA